MKSLIFKGDLVKALLDGRKTQTRRPIKVQPPSNYDRVYDSQWFHSPSTSGQGAEQQDCILIPESPFKTGETICVRETWCHDIHPVTARPRDGQFHYLADGKCVMKVDGDGFPEYRKDGSESSPWISPLHMPESASRIKLKISNVRVERIQDITHADAIHEGKFACMEYELGTDEADPPRDQFKRSWESIYPGSWEKNCFVWAYTFEVIK